MTNENELTVNGHAGEYQIQVAQQVSGELEISIRVDGSTVIEQVAVGSDLNSLRAYLRMLVEKLDKYASDT